MKDKLTIALTIVLPFIAIIVAAIVLSFLTGCNILPTVEPTVPTGVVANTVAVDATPTIPVITITGTVYVREVANEDMVVGYMVEGQTVHAVCDGHWCEFDNGLKVWRGCTSDNPFNLGCEKSP